MAGSKSGPKKRAAPNSVRATVIIPKEDYERLTDVAARECRTVTGQALYFIQRGLNSREEGNQNGEENSGATAVV